MNGDEIQRVSVITGRLSSDLDVSAFSSLLLAN